MKSDKLLLNLIVAGMTLGTAWAIRGQFGHEQGAAWAGGIGAIIIILMSGRQDWYNRLFKATLAAAIGWGLGGLMSYGLVVGYGRGTDFVNVYYGLLMLFLIGGLYGFVGGGLFGLVLSDTKDQQVKWLLLVVGMVTSGIIAYFFLIIEWGWLMTPPRSEVWAVCLGIGIFLAWFIHHYHFKAAFRVAVFAGLGGGFGFAFGNFLNVMGSVSGIAFNFWNVMEYSLGFFGGAGMAYGTFTSEWKSDEGVQRKSAQLIPILLVTLFIPYVVWQQTFSIERIQNNYQKLVDGNVVEWAWTIKILALCLILIQVGFVLYRFYFSKNDLRYSSKEVKLFLVTHFALYAVFSLLITGAIISTYRIEQYLYFVNYGVILFILRKAYPTFLPVKVNEHWGRNFLIILAFIALLALIAINMHGEIFGIQKRFEF